MRYFLAGLMGIFLGTMVSCAMAMPRLVPRYDGVDPKAAPLVNEWLSLAKLHGIKFDDTVSVGFTQIADKSIIGLTSYGFGFNEIDLDENYWNSATATSRMILVFHELVHSYCDRSHTYGNNIHYEEDSEKRNNERFRIILNNKLIPGYYSDFCPLSIMFPEIIPDKCTKAHYTEYTEEMFNNCEPI